MMATAATGDATAVLPAIGLDEMTARAGLLTRLDRKYLVPADELAGLLTQLEPGARVLEIDGLRRFGYESVYFDSPDLASYLATAHGRRLRFKVRTRTYLDTDDCFVEVKQRGPRGITVKSRTPYRLEERATLAADGTDLEACCSEGVAGGDHGDPVGGKQGRGRRGREDRQLGPAIQCRANHVDVEVVEVVVRDQDGVGLSQELGGLRSERAGIEQQRAVVGGEGQAGVGVLRQHGGNIQADCTGQLCRSWVGSRCAR